MPFMVSRRTALAGLGVFLIPGSVAAPAGARSRRMAPPQRGIRVDVDPLRANGSQTIAGWVEQMLPGALAQAFSARGMAGTPVTARIDYATLGPSSVGAGPGASPDQMSGEVSVNGATRPLRATTYYYPTAFDQTMIEQSNFYRVQQLCQAFAYWAAAGY
jgi:hypothetical protein